MNEKEIESKAKEVDPGWNDPPVFNYESHETHSRQSKGLSLNKRVVFPMSPNAGSPQSESNATGAPPSPGILSIPPPPLAKCPTGEPPKTATKNSTPVSTTTKLPEECTSEESDVPGLDVILRNFYDTLQQVYDQEEKESVEIKRRIAIMEKMWNEEKFNAIIKEKIYNLSVALKENRFDDGDNFQRSLMVDHTNVCSTWMAAIRKLIYRKKELTTSS